MPFKRNADQRDDTVVQIDASGPFHPNYPGDARQRGMGNAALNQKRTKGHRRYAADFR